MVPYEWLHRRSSKSFICLALFTVKLFKLSKMGYWWIWICPQLPGWPPLVLRKGHVAHCARWKSQVETGEEKWATAAPASTGTKLGPWGQERDCVDTECLILSYASCLISLEFFRTYQQGLLAGLFMNLFKFVFSIKIIGVHTWRLQCFPLKQDLFEKHHLGAFLLFNIKFQPTLNEVI